MCGTPHSSSPAVEVAPASRGPRNKRSARRLPMHDMAWLIVMDADADLCRVHGVEKKSLILRISAQSLVRGFSCEATTSIRTAVRIRMRPNRKPGVRKPTRKWETIGTESDSGHRRHRRQKVATDLHLDMVIKWEMPPASRTVYSIATPNMSPNTSVCGIAFYLPRMSNGKCRSKVKYVVVGQYQKSDHEYGRGCVVVA